MRHPLKPREIILRWRRKLFLTAAGRVERWGLGIALNKCTECNGKISDLASVCPHCGKSNPKSAASTNQQKTVILLEQLVDDQKKLLE